MRRLDRFLLPVLTCLVVPVAILFPQRLSQWRDASVLDGPHTEALRTENDLPTQPLSLEERMGLLAMYTEGLDPELTVIFQEREWDEETETLLRTELESLSESGVLPEGPLAENISGFSVQRLYLRSPEEIRGAAFLTIDVYSKAEDFWLYVTLDEETGRALALDTSGPAIKKFDAGAAAVGVRFLDRFGVEYVCDGDSESDAGFTLAGMDRGGIIVVKGQDVLRITPWSFYENEAAAVDSDGGGAGVYPK